MALALCIGFGGCAGYDEAVQLSDEYAGAPVASYVDSSGLWRIYDRPEEDRLKIGPSLARTFSSSFGPEVTFVPVTRGETQTSAERWLASVGRSCTVTGATPMVNQHWEFQYSCTR
jgi:hypothetical protein